jgi:serine/threonine-protein kinase
MEPRASEERIVVARRYALEAPIGSGGVGSVFAARDLATGARVAIKRLHAVFAHDAVAMARALREANAAREIRHPNVVEVLDAGIDDDGGVYLAMEVLEGESLSSLLEREGPLTFEHACELLFPIMSALAAAHARGFVHRDVKPENIFVSRNATGALVPKLLDFGLALLDGQSVTGGRSIVGTVAYAPPEQLRGDAHIGHAADVWSMGVVWYRCLSGRLPFSKRTLPATFVAILEDTPPSLCERASHVPFEVRQTIGAALRKHPGERPQCMDSFARRIHGAAARPRASTTARPDAETIRPPAMKKDRRVRSTVSRESIGNAATISIAIPG